MRRLALLIMGGALLILVSPHLISAFYLETASRLVHSTDFLLTDRALALKHLQKAIEADPNNAEAYRLLSKVNRAQGDLSAAIEALTIYTALRPRNPLGHVEMADLLEAMKADTGRENQELDAAIAWEWHQAGYTAEGWIDLGRAMENKGEEEAAGVVYERAIRLKPDWEEPHRLLAQTPAGDVLAADYLATGEPGAFEKARWLRPGDLYVNHRLWQEAQQQADLAGAVAYSETLVSFPLKAIHPTDERLLDYVAEVIPGLREEGLWDRSTTVNVAAFLVWQHYTAPGVEQLLERLMAQYPAEPEWPFYAAELYHRREDWERARAMYRQTVAMDPTYALAYLRLGMVAEAQSQLEEAARWYEQYRTRIPDDLLGLANLAGVYGSLGKADSAALDEELKAVTDDCAVAARLSGLPVVSVELGPNLITNGEFRIWSEQSPEGWIVSDMATGDPWNRGLFAHGADGLNAWHEKTPRVDGFWLQQVSEREPGRFGLLVWDENRREIGFVKLEARRSYLFTAVYRTEGLADGNATMWLTEKAVLGQAANEIGLPSTQGEWRQFSMLRCNTSSEPLLVSPLLRIWAPGRVWFDRVEIREVRSPAEFCPDSP